MENTNTKTSTKYVAFNELTRRMEDIEIEDAEILPGQSVIKMFYVASAGQWVTVPGASIYTMNADFQLILQS